MKYDEMSSLTFYKLYSFMKHLQSDFVFNWWYFGGLFFMLQHLFFIGFYLIALCKINSFIEKTFTTSEILIDYLRFSKVVLILFHHIISQCLLTLLWRRPLSYRNQSIDLQSKFLYANGLLHERVKCGTEL